jgi:hypothetical protein
MVLSRAVSLKLPRLKLLTFMKNVLCVLPRSYLWNPLYVPVQGSVNTAMKLLAA